MSTIKVDNIRIASESVSRPATGVAAAWCQYTTVTTTAIKASYNISSLTDAGTGITNVEYTNNMASDNYPVTLAANSFTVRESSAVHLANNCTVVTSNASNTKEDVASVNFSSLGDLA